VADQPDQKQPGTTLAFQKALTQASALWDKTPVSILDQQAAQTHALLLAMGKYITYRKEKGELESCADIAGINRAEQILAESEMLQPSAETLRRLQRRRVLVMA
jgi:hypothetical protein